MKNRISFCENCNEDTRHSKKKVFSSKRKKLRREGVEYETKTYENCL